MILERKSPARTGAILIAVLVLFACVGPLLSSFQSETSHFANGRNNLDLPLGPSTRFWLGTDRLFRDQWVRLGEATRLSLVLGVAASVAAGALGTMVGILAGYFQGKHYARIVSVDGILMTVVDVGLSFPFLLLVMAVTAAFERTNAWTVFLILAATGWLGIARLVRSKTLLIREREFVTAARAMGQPVASILRKHILPNVLGPVIVATSFSVAQMVLAESVLSYLGAGISPPTPTLGRMLYEGQDLLGAAPWLFAAPVVVLVVMVYAFNLLGEGLRDALDPSK